MCVGRGYVFEELESSASTPTASRIEGLKLQGVEQLSQFKHLSALSSVSWFRVDSLSNAKVCQDTSSLAMRFRSQKKTKESGMRPPGACCCLLRAEDESQATFTGLSAQTTGQLRLSAPGRGAGGCRHMLGSSAENKAHLHEAAVDSSVGVIIVRVSVLC